MYFVPALMLSRPRPLSIIAITIAPSTALFIEPRPPNRLVPPITAAAIEYSRIAPPPVDVSTELSREASTMPPSAAIVLQIMNTTIRTPVDVDAGSPGRLGVAADRVDVAPEARAQGHERPQEVGPEHDQRHVRKAAVGVGDRHDDEAGQRQPHHAGDHEHPRLVGQARLPARREWSSNCCPTYAATQAIATTHASVWPM